MPTEEKKKKRINWWKYKHRCPKCDATNIVWNNVFRRKWILTSKGNWELKEQQQRECEHCHHTWWM